MYKETRFRLTPLVEKLFKFESLAPEHNPLLISKLLHTGVELFKETPNLLMTPKISLYVLHLWEDRLSHVEVLVVTPKAGTHGIVFAELLLMQIHTHNHYHSHIVTITAFSLAFFLMQKHISIPLVLLL